MNSLSPALLELVSKAMDDGSTYEELLRHLQLARKDTQMEDIDRIQRIDGATVDLGREARCGFGEVIFGEGKSAELVTRIIQTQLDQGQAALVTRIDSGVAFQVRQSFQYSYHNPSARTLRVSLSEVDCSSPLTMDQGGDNFHAAVVTAGSTDIGVAEEAIETLVWMGIPFRRFDDIGVAGPQRLAAVVPELRQASAAVVVAGMEGALPAVVAGHLAAPVFAVPTSVGYGTNLGGLTPLMGMLSSCAANVAAVNIDGGFKGGYMAGVVVRQLMKHCQKVEEEHAVQEVQA
ncbi:MAG: nickel pincer cofactor biosynthesis protein LarB [Rubripirellula sp.]